MSVQKLIGAGAFCAAVLAAGTGANAGTVGIAWDAADGAAGYKVHYGPNSSNYTNVIDVGNVLETDISALDDCTDWYFAVSAYNAAGDSDLSNEVFTWPRTRVDNATPTATIQGEQFTVTLNGGNFDPSLEWEIVWAPDPCVPDPANPGVERCQIYSLDAPTISCRQAQWVQTVEPIAADVRAAQVGNYAMVLRSKDGSRVAPPIQFRVDIDPARFDINRTDDVTRDRIDVKDTIVLARVFGVEEGGASFDADYDFDGDGWVDGSDLAYLASNLGRCWSGSQWTVNACPEALR